MFIKKWFSHIHDKKWHSHIHQTKRAKFLKFRSHRTCWDMFFTVCLATSWHCCPRKGYCTQQAIYGQWTSSDIWATGQWTSAPDAFQPENTEGLTILRPSTRYIHQVLKLSENLIKEVDQKAFLNLGTSLEHLDLSGNKLKMMQEETFRPLYGLQVCRFIPFFSSFIIFSSSFPSLYSLPSS